MFIVVAGAGKVGFHLARALVPDHEVLIIEATLRAAPSPRSWAMRS
jgi:Trk K+ transport system NAD-binding subunit